MTYSTEKQHDLAILAGIDRDEPGFGPEASFDELAELARTAGVEVADRLCQKRPSPHNATFLGKGKLDELKDLVNLHNATMLIFDGELTPAQLRHLNDFFDVKIIDRTLLILDIFAGRAHSAEGKVQVELAQLRYRASRLSGMGKGLSRLAGGIGTRGPGESKLESDRRHVRQRISTLAAELAEIRQHRSVLRERRVREGVFTASLVGYTNAGKSSILNSLTDASVLAEDKLFATLDTTTRRLELPNGRPILLTDTVGFIQKLPHHLVQAFRATLEELNFSDLLIHVVDASSSLREERMAVVYDTLRDIGCQDKPVLTVFNKMDLDVAGPLPGDRRAEGLLELSVMTGQGREALITSLEDFAGRGKARLRVLIPYSEGGLVSFLHSACEVLAEEHQENGTLLELLADKATAERLNGYTINYARE